jgi:hypothetical protein
MDRELQSMLVVLGELEQAGLTTLANAVELFVELAWRYGERSTQELLNIACCVASSDEVGRPDLAATELMNEYRACLRELAASSNRLSMDFFANLDEARAWRMKPVPRHSGN